MEKKSTYRDMVLLAAAFPPPPTFLALDKLPPPGSSRAAAAGNRSAREVFNVRPDPASAGHPPGPPPRLDPLPRQALGEGAEVLYTYI